MRGGGGSRRIGNAAEAFVADLLRREYQSALAPVVILPLQQDAPADLVALFQGQTDHDWCLYEVKCRKTRREALSARLSPKEQEAFDVLHPDGPVPGDPGASDRGEGRRGRQQTSV